MLQSDLCDYSYPYIVVEVTITVGRENNDAYDQTLLAFKKMHNLLAALQKLIIHLLIMEKI